MEVMAHTEKVYNENEGCWEYPIFRFRVRFAERNGVKGRDYHSFPASSLDDLSEQLEIFFNRAVHCGYVVKDSKYVMVPWWEDDAGPIITTEYVYATVTEEDDPRTWRFYSDGSYEVMAW